MSGNQSKRRRSDAAGGLWGRGVDGMTNTCKQCRWFREHSNPEANGMGICVVPLPPTIERMIGKSGSVLFKEDMERGCALLTPPVRMATADGWVDATHAIPHNPG